MERSPLAQQRYDEAETNYRNSLNIYGESDRRAASATAALLGIALAARGQHHEAARIFVYSAVAWHQETGQWSKMHMQWIRGEQSIIAPDEFTELVSADLRADLARELFEAIETAIEPEEANKSSKEVNMQANDL